MTLTTAIKFETRKPRDINSLETFMEGADDDRISLQDLDDKHHFMIDHLRLI